MLNISKKIKFLGLVSLISVVTGCATIMSGSTDTINVQAVDSRTQQPISNAKCRLSDSKGGVYLVDGNPGKAIVNRGSGAIQTSCTAAGYSQKEVGVGTSFNGWTVVNVLFWPGLIVDGISGAYSKYPSHITVVMEKN